MEHRREPAPPRSPPGADFGRDGMRQINRDGRRSRFHPGRAPIGALAAPASTILGALLLLCACGGTAVRDGTNTSEVGGAGGGPLSSGGGGSSGVCSTPAPTGQSSVCGGTSTETSCSVSKCDEAGNRWVSTCTATGCSCSYDLGEISCSCVGGDFAGFCAGTGHSCCPGHFQ